jgi:hypothetical protein
VSPGIQPNLLDLVLERTLPMPEGDGRRFGTPRGKRICRTTSGVSAQGIHRRPNTVRGMTALDAVLSLNHENIREAKKESSLACLVHR